MEDSNATIHRGGKHEPVNITQHEEVVKFFRENRDGGKFMSDELRRNNSNIDDVLGVFDHREQKKAETVDSGRFRVERIDSTSRMNQGRAAKEVSDRLRKNSLEGKKSSNSRGKTKTDKNWKTAAVSLLIIASFAGGLGLKDSVADVYSTIKKTDELKQETRTYQQQIDEAFTNKTFTGDTQIDYEGIAQMLEKDGIDNKDLYMTVAALGEVKADAVLDSASNPPADSIESYMRNNNITSINDWMEKTVQQEILKDQERETQRQLDTIFKDSENTASPKSNNIGGK